MNTHFKSLTLAALLALFAGESFADSGSKTTPCYIVGKTINVDSGCTLNVKSGGALNLNTGSTETNQATKTSGGSTDVSGIVFSTALTGNPLMQTTDGLIAVASANAGSTVLTGVSGRTVYPGGGIMLMASGSAAGATGVYLACKGSGNIIASVPIAMLLDKTPVSPFKSAGSGTGSPVLGSAFTAGCLISDGIYISTTGTLSTTTHLYYSIPYTVQ